jgi:hypothetical protein
MRYIVLMCRFFLLEDAFTPSALPATVSPCRRDASAPVLWLPLLQV